MAKTNLWKCVTISADIDGTLDDELIPLLLDGTNYQGIEEPDNRNTNEQKWNVYYLPQDCTVELISSISAKAKNLGFSINIKPLQDIHRENWQENWKQYFRPVKVSDELVILPDWIDKNKYDAHYVIRIHPGMAFGTGIHATTQLCLCAILKHCLVSDDHNTLLDCGCGTGILSILGVMVGMKRTVSFDIDPDIDENARLNIALNLGEDSVIDLRVCELNDITVEPFPYIVCNMLSKEFKPLLLRLPQYAQQGTLLILSGLLLTEEDEIKALLNRIGFNVIDKTTLNEWSCFVAEYGN